MARLILILTAMLLLAGSCFRRVALPPATATPAPAPSPTPTPVAGLIGDPAHLRPIAAAPFGIQVPDRGTDDTYAYAARLGARWARINLFWREIEPERTSPPTYRWETTDRRLRRLVDAGLHPLVTVRDNPPWAADTICGPLRASGLAGFVEFMRAMVQRYSVPPYNIHHWELYNEPDNDDRQRLADLGGCWGQHGREYAEMLRAVYPAVKSADPQAQLLLGGIAYEDYDKGSFVPDFLDDVLDAGGGAYFDILNFHYYPVFSDVWNRYGNDIGGKADYLRTELQRYGLRKPLAVTEVGQPTFGPEGDEQPYSEEGTSRYVVQAMARGMVADLQVIIWYTLLDHPDDPRKYGLLYSDGTPKPSYNAYRVLVAELGEARAGRPLQKQDVGADSVEGYLFALADGRQKAVLWSLPSQGLTWSENEQPVALAGPALRVVSLYGEERIVQDGSANDADGQKDGRVTVPVGPAPVYLQVQPETR